VINDASRIESVSECDELATHPKPADRGSRLDASFFIGHSALVSISSSERSCRSERVLRSSPASRRSSELARRAGESVIKTSLSDTSISISSSSCFRAPWHRHVTARSDQRIYAISHDDDTARSLLSSFHLAFSPHSPLCRAALPRLIR